MNRESKYQNKLLEIYSKYRLLPPIKKSFKNSFKWSKSLESSVSNELKSLNALCYRKLPWIARYRSFTSKDSDSVMESKIKAKMSRHTTSNYNLDEIVIESNENIFKKYRNCDRKCFELKTSDFALRYRHKIENLRVSQVLFTGEYKTIVNDAEYFDNIEKRLESRRQENMDRRMAKLILNETVRSRIEYMHESFFDKPYYLDFYFKKFDDSYLNKSEIFSFTSDDCDCVQMSHLIYSSSDSKLDEEDDEKDYYKASNQFINKKLIRKPNTRYSLLEKVCPDYVLKQKAIFELTKYDPDTKSVKAPVTPEISPVKETKKRFCCCKDVKTKPQN